MTRTLLRRHETDLQSNEFGTQVPDVQCFNSRSHITRGWIQVSNRQLSNTLNFLRFNCFNSSVAGNFEMWITWMSQKADEGPKNPSVSYQNQALLLGFNRTVPPTPVILILPRYWIGLLTHLQHDNPKAGQCLKTHIQLAIPCSQKKSVENVGRMLDSVQYQCLFSFSFQTSWTGYQLHQRHRDDVAQLRSCERPIDKVHFR